MVYETKMVTNSKQTAPNTIKNPPTIDRYGSAVPVTDKKDLHHHIGKRSWYGCKKSFDEKEKKKNDEEEPQAVLIIETCVLTSRLRDEINRDQRAEPRNTKERILHLDPVNRR